MLDLMVIPAHLFFDVLRKLKGRHLCRLRQTCKYIDKLVESNRFSINSRHSSSSLWFHAQMDENSRTPVLKMFVLPETVVWHKRTYESSFSSGEITDPYKQLSAISFKRIVVNSYQKYFAYVISEEAVPILKKLRTNCEILCFSFIPAEYVPHILPLIKFEILSIENFMICPDIANWEIQNCKKLIVTEYMFPITNLLPYVASFEEVSVEFIGCHISSLDGMARILNLVSDLQVFPNRGKLKKIIWTLPSILHIKNHEDYGLEFLHPYRELRGTTRFAFCKGEIPGGEMLIEEHREWTTFTFHLCEGSIRETLFEQLYPGGAHKTSRSEVYTQFMNAETDGEACDDFQEFVDEAQLLLPYFIRP